MRDHDGKNKVREKEPNRSMRGKENQVTIVDPSIHDFCRFQFELPPGIGKSNVLLKDGFLCRDSKHPKAVLILTFSYARRFHGV